MWGKLSDTGDLVIHGKKKHSKTEAQDNCDSRSFEKVDHCLEQLNPRWAPQKTAKSTKLGTVLERALDFKKRKKERKKQKKKNNEKRALEFSKALILVCKGFTSDSNEEVIEVKCRQLCARNHEGESWPTLNVDQNVWYFRANENCCQESNENCYWAFLRFENWALSLGEWNGTMPENHDAVVDPVLRQSI